MDGLLQKQPSRLTDAALVVIGQRFETTIQDLETASLNWAARPNSPESRFISAMIGSMRGFAELALSLASDGKEAIGILESVVDRRVQIAEKDVEKMKLALEESASLLDKAKQTLTLVEVDKERILKTAVSLMSADITEALRRPMLVRATNLNTERLWIRYMWAGAAAAGLLFLGLFMGELNATKPGMAELAIRQCAANPVTDGKGKSYCDLSHLQAGLY